MKENGIQWWIQDFPNGGRQPLNLGQKSIIWQDCCCELHENERNWTEKWAHVRGVPPRSANGIKIDWHQIMFVVHA